MRKIKVTFLMTKRKTAQKKNLIDPLSSSRVAETQTITLISNK